MLNQGSKRKKATALETVLREYIQTSTVAGLHFAFDRTQPKFGQVLWLVTVFLLTVTGIYISVGSYFDWINDPVVTTVTSTGTPVTDVPFPSVVICSEGYNEDNFFSSFWKIILDALQDGHEPSTEINISPIRMHKYTQSNKNMSVTNKEQETLRRLESILGSNLSGNSALVKKILGQEADILALIGLVTLQLIRDPTTVIFLDGKDMGKIMNIALDNALRSKEFDKVNEAVDFKRKIFSSYKGERVYKMFMKLLWFTNMPCSDIRGVTSEFGGQKSVVKFCKWKGLAINCSAIFKKVTTDVGICCAFNRESADKIYVESAYTSALKELEDFESKNSIDSSELPDWYLNNNEPNTQPGNQMGLSLVLDSHSDQIAPFSITSDFQAFTVAVIPPDVFPMMSLSGFQVRPGHKNQVMVSAIKVNASNDIRSIDPMKRNCYFPDEIKVMKLYQKYSQTNCFFECKLLYAQRTLGKQTSNMNICTPWIFPFIDNRSRMCDPWEKSKTLDIMANSVPASACSFCLPDCNQFIYQTVITTAAFRGCDNLNFGMTDHCSLNSLGTTYNRTDHDPTKAF